MKRPFFRYKYQELRTLFEKSKTNEKVIKDLLEELKHRKTPKAVGLRNEIQHHFKTLRQDRTHHNPSSATPESRTEEKASGKNDSGLQGSSRSRIAKDENFKNQIKVATEPVRSHEFKTVEPIGKAFGHPDKRDFPLKDDVDLQLPPNSPLHQRFAVALRQLITEMKQKGKGARKLELDDGRAVHLDGRENGYQFQYEDSADLFEGAAVTARVGTTDTPGRIVAVMQGSIIVSLEKDIGETISYCVLSVDNTAMLEALAQRLDQITQNKEANFNYALAAAAVTEKQVKSGRSLVTSIEDMGNLNQRQQTAVRLALSHEISYIWGPPGTGKTMTLGALIDLLFRQEKRVLICSNTNQAVDQVLLKLCEVMTVAHPAVNDGRIIRIGRIANEELKNQWTPYVTLSGVAERQSTELIERRKQLEADVGPLRERISSIEKLLSLLDQIQAAKEEERRQKSIMLPGQKRLDKLEQLLKSLEGKLSRLDEELLKVKNAGVLRRVFMRSEDSILNDRRQTEQRISTAQGDLRSARKEAGDAAEALENIRKRLKELMQAVPSDSGSRNQLERTKSGVESQLQPLLSEIADINKKLADMESTILQGALIIGATVTKTYLSPKQFVGFDVVIVDEASMVLLPALYYVVGLSAAKAVISGDFRQLPPIVETEQMQLVKTLGQDVFKSAGVTDAVESGVLPQNVVMLDVQYRMEEKICNLVSSTMYRGFLKTEKACIATGGLPQPFQKTLVIVDTSRIWPFSNRDAFGSKYNLMHALAIRNLCLYLKERKYIQNTGDVGIATPYAAQAKLLKSIMSGSGLEKSVAAGTVHRYQGDEKSLMILDIPDSLGEERVGIFLEADSPEDQGAKLFNVGISRAKDHLVVFANLTYLQDKLPDRAWLRDILHTMQSSGQIVDVHEVLEFRPIMEDLGKLQRHFELDVDAEKAGLFHQKDFESVCSADIENAGKGVAIFSGFVTPKRVAAYGDLFRRKINEGVAIRCITRPPRANGSIPEDQGKEALDALEGIGCLVDGRWSIHEKVVIIDEEIVWFGSLNMLSHTAQTDEMMMRIENPEAASQVALFMTLRRTWSGETTEGLSVKKENPRCPKCESRTYYAKGKYGPFWSCEDCDWTQSFDSPIGSSKTRPSNQKPSRKQVKEGPKCPECGRTMVIRKGRFGDFYGCPGYPKCKGKRSLRKVGKARTQ